MEYPTTVGNWLTEADSAAALDAALEQVGLWAVYKEVSGTLTHVRPGQRGQTIRIDRVLIPNSKLIALGWTHGIIGIEVKRSGEKIGPPIAQAMDYSRTIWHLPQAGIKVWLDWVFVWPMERQNGTIASILAHNRIGSAHATPWMLLHLKVGELNLITIDHTHEIRLGGAPATGLKVGSR